jgi:hypothetical protein
MRVSCYKSYLSLLPVYMLAISIIAANTQLSKSLYTAVLRFRFHTHRPSIYKARERRADGGGGSYPDVIPISSYILLPNLTSLLGREIEDGCLLGCCSV